VAGQQVTLRWSLVSDDVITATGWWINTLAFGDGVRGLAPAPVSMTADAPGRRPSN
jgi:hypothetical protein